jgi:hypothetical protein
LGNEPSGGGSAQTFSIGRISVFFSGIDRLARIERPFHTWWPMHRKLQDLNIIPPTRLL